jgi:hypothetical protein
MQLRNLFDEEDDDDEEEGVIIASNLLLFIGCASIRPVSMQVMSTSGTRMCDAISCQILDENYHEFKKKEDLGMNKGGDFH